MQALITILVVAVVICGSAGSAKSGEMQAPGGFLMLPAIVLGSADFFLLFGNINDIQSGEASRGRGVLGVTLGTVTVLAAAGLGVGTEAIEFAVGIGVVGLATIGSGIWAISKAETKKTVSMAPYVQRDHIGVAIRCQW